MIGSSKWIFRVRGANSAINNTPLVRDPGADSQLGLEFAGAVIYTIGVRPYPSVFADATGRRKK